MKPGAAPPLPPGLIDEAIHWAIQLQFNVPSAATRQAFEAWLQAHPTHSQAWERMQALQSDFGRLPAPLALDTLQGVQRLRQARSSRRRQTLQLLSGSGIAAAMGWLGYAHAPWQRLLADASTSVGEQRSVTLADGSTIVLNTDTAIGTDLLSARRLVVLRRGEILVTTGADAGAPSPRPFWVHTPFGSLRALGTRFVVRLQPQHALVSVQEGTVQMHPAQGGDAAIATPGTHWRLSAQSGSQTPAPDFGADDWADGVISGCSIRLADLLAELNRYRHGHIACDERVADLRLSGTYHLRQTEQVLRLIAQTQPVRIRSRTSWWIQVEPASAR